MGSGYGQYGGGFDDATILLYPPFAHSGNAVAMLGTVNGTAARDECRENMRRHLPGKRVRRSHHPVQEEHAFI